MINQKAVPLNIHQDATQLIEEIPKSLKISLASPPFPDPGSSPHVQILLGRPGPNWSHSKTKSVQVTVSKADGSRGDISAKTGLVTAGGRVAEGCKEDSSTLETENESQGIKTNLKSY